MNGTLYWYLSNGKIRAHGFPPESRNDPYAMVEVRDLGFGKTAAHATVYINNKPTSEETFVSNGNYDRVRIRNEVESWISSNLKEQKRLSQWVEARKSKKSTSKSKRKTKSNKTK